MSNFNLVPSGIDFAAPAVCIGYGESYFGNGWVAIHDVDGETMCSSHIPSPVCREELFYLFERYVHPNVQEEEPELNIEGDIAAPKAKVFSYRTDIMDLAKSHKRLEAEYSDELLYGIELEFNHTGHSLMELSPLLGMGIFKQDSSVDGEFVTLPYVYDELCSKINKLAEVFDKLLSANSSLTPWSEVGMHVHISRKGLSPAQLSLLRFAFTKEEVAPISSYLCGRYPNRYCKYQRYTGNRYVALNESNANTVEIRAFLSPSSAEGVLENLAIVKDILDGRWLLYDKAEVAKWWKGRFPEPILASTRRQQFIEDGDGDMDGDT